MEFPAQQGREGGLPVGGVTKDEARFQVPEGVGVKAAVGSVAGVEKEVGTGCGGEEDEEGG